MQKEKIKKNLSTIVKKSTEMAKSPMKLVELNRGLNLRQQRFFNMAILAVNGNGVSEFGKGEYGSIFKDDTDNFYSSDVKADIVALGSLGLLSDTDGAITWKTVFIEVQYDKKTNKYRFDWSPLMLEHVRDIQQNYIQQDLQVLALFKNKYSFIWYDFFKSNYHQWKWKVSKNEVINLLRLENKKSYLEKHSMMYKQCIEAPLKELNEFTEYHVTCEVIKKGRIVVGYEFKRYQESEVEYTVSEKQINTLQEIVDRYGDTAKIVRWISKYAVVDADAYPFLTDLLFEIKAFDEKFIQNADSYTSESFRDIVKLAIAKDNAFKKKMRELMQKRADNPTIDDFLPQQEEKPRDYIFYNWLDERE